MKVSLFSNAYDELPKLWEGEWQEFAAVLGPHEYSHPSKEECPAFSPAEFAPGTLRENQNVVALHMFVLDVDAVDEETALTVGRELEELGLCGALYTTWGHAAVAPALWKLRVVIPLSRAVPASAWADFWSRANSLFGGICDPKCKNTSRIYFGPTAPAGTEELNFYHVFEGQPLDVDLIGAIEADVLPPPAVDQTELSQEDFERFAKSLAGRRSDDRKAEVGALLMKVARGEVFADKGSRDTVLFKLSLILADRFPDRTPESIAECFRPSLSLMGKLSSDCPTVEQAAYKIRRAQEARRVEEAQVEEEHRSRIREAFKNGRSDPYSLEELNSFGKLIGKRWIIQRGRSFYFFVAGDYVGPFTSDDMQTAAQRELAPAASAGVQLFKTLKDGSVIAKPINQLVGQYGTVAQRTIIDLRAQRASYEEDTRTIIEAPCPLRKLEAVFYPEIDRWLQLMAGPKYENLKTWLAAMTRLDEPCVALFLTGKKGTGKSLLANGAAHLWTTNRPTPLEEVFSDFNETLMRCPLCFADEQLPKDHRGYAKNAELRHHIQATLRPMKRKFQPTADMLGATRTIIAANNEDVLSTPENLSAHDIEAIIDRYFHIRVQDESAEYLKDVDTSEWVRGDRIAQHITWLIQNHEWEAQGRFLMRIDDEGLHRALATRTGVRSAICQWLTGYILNPKPFDNDARSQSFVRIKDGKLLVNAQGLLACWEHYVKNERCPTTGHLSSDLIALCETTNGKRDQRMRYFNKAGVRVHYRVFNIENLIAWAEKAGWADREQIYEALSKDTVDLTIDVKGASN